MGLTREKNNLARLRAESVLTPLSSYQLLRERFRLLQKGCLERNPDTCRRIVRATLYRIFEPFFKKHYLYQARRTASTIEWKNIYCGEKRGLVSVVLPVYNQADFIEESIESVLSQTYRDFELIIVNDGSTDGVERILDKYVTHPKILILTQENKKLPAALNTGFSHAKGEFLTWVSADNVMLPTQFAEQVQFLRQNDFIQMVYCNYHLVDKQGKPFQDLVDHGSHVINTDRDIRSLHYTYNFINACFMYRSYIARIIGNYHSDMYGAEDYDYWLRINNYFTIQHIGHKKSYYKYRLHGNTILRREGEGIIEITIKKAQKLERQRRSFSHLPISLFVHKDMMLNQGQMDWPSKATRQQIVQYENSKVLDTLISNRCREVNGKTALFLTTAQMKADEYLSIIRRFKDEKLLCSFGMISDDIDNNQRDFMVLLDWVIVDSKELHDSLFCDYKDKLLCLPSWENYQYLYTIITNHHLFYKQMGRMGCNAIPEHIVYRSEKNEA